MKSPFGPATKARSIVRAAALAAALLAGASPAATQTASPAVDTPVWQDNFERRLEALAVIQTLNGEILASSSATLTLEKWCRDHQLAPEPRIRARLIRTARRSEPTPGQLVRLEVASADEVSYRRVELRCGARLLSEAENWYVPSRLGAEANRLLETSETPFGKAVQPLEPRRQTFEARILWWPLPEGWERMTHGSMEDPRLRPLLIPENLFEHRAVLYARNRRPIAEVHEIYRRDLLAFRPPVRE